LHEEVACGEAVIDLMEPVAIPYYKENAAMPGLREPGGPRCRVGKDVWKFDTANVTAATSAEAYWQWTQADVVGFQETREARWDEINAFEQKAGRDGWRLHASGSGAAKGSDRIHSSGGVAVAAQGKYGMALSAVVPVAECLQGRFTVTWLGGLRKGGVHVMSAYLWTGEGMSVRNADLLDAVALYIATIRGCWILMGDFNMTPEELMASGWPKMVGGFVFAHDGPEGTVRPARLTYDFFLVSERLKEDVIGVESLTDGPVKTHTAQRLLVRGGGRGRNRTRRVLSAPKPISAQLMPGPVMGPLAAGADVCPKEATQLELDRAAGEWVKAVERELISLVPGIDDEARAKSLGRGEGPEFVLKSAAGPPAAKYPKMPPGAIPCLQAANWARDVGWAALRNGPVADGLKAKRLRQLLRLWQDERLPVELEVALAAALQGGAAPAAALAAAATKLQLKLCRAQAYLSQKAWFGWAKAGQRSGGKRVHRWSRAPVGWVPSKVSITGSDDMDMAVFEPRDAQGETDDYADFWGCEWAEGADVALPVWPADMPPMPLLKAADLRRAALTFPECTAMGADKLAPKAFARLSDMLLNALGLIFQVVEFIGAWPLLWQWLVVVLLDKEDGGKRPIGLFVGAVRVWGRARRKWVSEWEADHDRPFFWGGKGKSADVAAWKAAMFSELAVTAGAESGETMLDLVKAFERVGWARLAAEGQVHGYPLVLLRASIATYKFNRLVTVAGVFARAILATRGIVAGSASATTELRLALLTIFDQSVARNPDTLHYVMVDDSRLQVAGPARRVRRRLVKVSMELGKALVAAGFEVSRKKGVITASRMSIAKLVAADLKELGVHVEATFRWLGADSSGGRVRGMKVLRKRLLKFKARRRRYKVLRKAGVGVARLVRTGGKAAMVYGESVLGVADSFLQEQRRAVAAVAAADGAGKQLDLVLIFADLTTSEFTDPAFEAHCGPLVSWSRCIWYGWFGDGVLKTAVERSETTLRQARRMWTKVVGPAKAMLATAWRLKWKVPKFDEFITDEGLSLKLRLVSPATVRAEVRAAVKRWQWRNVAAAAPAGAFGIYGPRAEPLRKLLSKCEPGWTLADRMALHSSLVGGQWPQARLFQAGLCDDPFCTRCATGRGTVHHRVWCCAEQEFLRQELVRPALVAEARRGDVGSWWWTRALRPSLPLPAQRPADGTFEWVIAPSSPGDTVHCDVVFTDGSMFDGPGEFEALGWGFVAYRGGRVVAKARGVPPAALHGNYGAELWGLLQGLKHTCGTRTLYIDCEAVEQRYGTTRAMSGDELYAEAWRQIRAVDSAIDATVVWVKGHITQHMVEAGEWALFQKEGNDAADELAKAAARVYRYQEEFIKWHKDYDDGIREVAKAIGQITAKVLETGGDHVPPPPGRGRPKKGAPRRKKAKPPALSAEDGGHVWAKAGSRWKCCHCPLSVATKGRHEYERCRGGFVAGAGQHGGRPHIFWAAGRFLFCARCGAYSSLRARGLARGCPGKPAGPMVKLYLRRLWAGRHPTKGTLEGPPRWCPVGPSGIPAAVELGRSGSSGRAWRRTPVFGFDGAGPEAAEATACARPEAQPNPGSVNGGGEGNKTMTAEGCDQIPPAKKARNQLTEASLTPEERGTPPEPLMVPPLRSILRKRPAPRPRGGERKRLRFSPEVHVVPIVSTRHLKDLWTSGIDKTCEDCGGEIRGRLVLAGAPGKPRSVQDCSWCRRCKKARTEEQARNETQARGARVLADAAETSRATAASGSEASRQAVADPGLPPEPASTRAAVVAATAESAFLRRRALDSLPAGTVATDGDVQTALLEARRARRERTERDAQAKRRRRG
jgi:ribonuclease HI